MLVTMTLVMCLLSNANHCQQVRPEEQSIGLAACGIRGQQLAAQWLEEHPKWFFDHVRCTPGNPPREDDI